MSTEASGRAAVEMPSHRTPDGIPTVTLGTFEEAVLDAEGPVAVEFMSYGCIHCRAMEPIIQEVARMVESKETVVRVNVAVEERLAANYEIQGTPTMVMFLGGREVARVEGPSPTVATVLAVVTKPFEQSR